jgi:hypothetical protein
MDSHMSFQWLQMRIQEEQDRRERHSTTLERLPKALEDLYTELKGCVEGYTTTFGSESAEIGMAPTRIKISAREERDGRWHPVAKVEVILVPDIPGFRVERGEYSMAVEVGVLPSLKLFYRDREQDKYLTMEELTRRILDRALFPGLRDQ